MAAFALVVAVLVFLFGLVLDRSFRVGIGAALLVPTFLLIGIAVADFISGVFHFLADRFGNEAIPILGRNVIAPFREHHHAPAAMVRHAFAETNGDNAMIVLVPSVIVATLSHFASNPHLAVIVASFSFSFVGSILATNQIHKWAHCGRRVPRLVRRMQGVGLLLSPKHHARHHRHPHDRAYCITTGWWNPWLDRFGFFPRLENLIRDFLPTSWYRRP